MTLDVFHMSYKLDLEICMFYVLCGETFWILQLYIQFDFRNIFGEKFLNLRNPFVHFKIEFIYNNLKTSRYVNMILESYSVDQECYFLILVYYSDYCFVGKYIIEVSLDGKHTEQSSDYMYKNSFPASNAIDGDLSTFSHTSSQTNPFWILDLGTVSTVKMIEVFARTDCCGKFKENLLRNVCFFYLEKFERFHDSFCLYPLQKYGDSLLCDVYKK